MLLKIYKGGTIIINTRKFKKMVAICLCTIMAVSIGMISNAATYDHAYYFYVDSVGGSAKSGYCEKTNTKLYADLYVETYLFNGPEGQLKMRLLRDDTPASTTFALNYGGDYAVGYRSSSYAVKGDYYAINAYTTTSCGYGAYLGGTWTP